MAAQDRGPSAEAPRVEDLWEAMAPVLFASRRLARAVADVDGILARLQPGRGARILDLGSGAGARAIELARRGFRVTGVDIVPAFVDFARDSARAAGVDVRFVHADMLEFEEPRAYDAAVCVFNLFGFFGDADTARLLGHLHASLVPGGGLLLEILGREVMERQWRDLAAGEVDDTLFIERRTLEAEGTRLASHWSITTEQGRRDFVVRQRLYRAGEIADLLVRCGFGAPEIYGSPDGAPYDEIAEFLVAVCRA
jgi:cyclopropane fatty-acyl-phospholipid synthase-like methyltransferase